MLPALEYGSHGLLRKGYKYGDDLIIEHNWRSELNSYDAKIDKYIDERSMKEGRPEEDLLDVSIPVNLQKTKVYQTMSASILEYNLFGSLGSMIKREYEHFDRYTNVGDIKGSVSIASVDQIPKSVSRDAAALQSLSLNIKKNTAVLGEIKSIQFYKSFLQTKNYSKGILVSENPPFTQFGVSPEIMGHDIATRYASVEDYYSTAFTTASLLGWKYTTPQQRTVGSPVYFGGILLDIVFQNIKKTSSFGSAFLEEGKASQNLVYLFDNTKKYYESIIESNVIQKMQTLGFTDVVGKNPFVLSFENHEHKQPLLYTLWCTNTAVRVPFYNRKLIRTNEYEIKWSQFLNYKADVKAGDLVIYQEPNQRYEKQKQISVQTIRTMIVKQLKGDSKMPSALSIIQNQIISGFNSKNSKSTSFGNQNVQEEVVAVLENLSNAEWYNLISAILNCLYLELLILSNVPWGKYRRNYGSDFVSFSLERMQYKVKNGNMKYLSDKTVSDVEEYLEQEQRNYRQTIRELFGKSKQFPMGGLSLISNSQSAFSVSRFSSIVRYPGDEAILNYLSDFSKAFLSDVGVLQKEMKKALYHLSHRYWYRDVIRWLEVLFDTFEPEAAPEARAYSLLEVKQRFFRLETLLKILMGKQMAIMQRYAQKSKSIIRRYSEEKVSESLQTEISQTASEYETTLCYLKRQVQIVYHLLNRISESWWVRLSLDRKSRDIEPPYSQEDFLGAYNKMKVNLQQWYQTELAALLSSIADQRIQASIRSMSSDVCPESEEENLDQKLSDLANLRTTADYWLTWLQKLKNVNTLDKENKYNVYLPLYITKDNEIKFYLFDIMPLLLEGKYKSAFGLNSQWLSADDLETVEFTENKVAVVILSNKTKDMANADTWKAIDVRWFDRLNEKASQFDMEKKLWVLRTSIYLLMSDENIYTSSVLNKVSLMKNREDENSLVFLLEEYQTMGQSEQEDEDKVIRFVSREFAALNLV